MSKTNRALNVLYITSYYLEDVCKQRNPYRYISQAGMNKANFMLDLMHACGYNVYVWSNAWTNSRSFRFYKGFQSKENDHVYYSSIFGAPLFNVLSCEWSGKRFVRQFMKENPIDLVIFYNMRVETSGLARYIKRNYNVPIILEYEDGLERDTNNNFFKRLIYRVVQNRVKKDLDGAIVVNSLVQNSFLCDSVVIRGAAKKNNETMRGLAEGEKLRVLFASTLDEQRGILVVLEALKHTNLDFELYITGKGPQETAITSFRDERIHYLGYLEYEEYKELLKSSHVCINAQKSGQEYAQVSFPSKMFEYLSMNKLIVSSDVADIEHCMGEAVLVYHNDDPKELAERIEQAYEICRDDMAREEYGERITKCMKDNSMEKLTAKLGSLTNYCVLDYRAAQQ